MAAGKDIETTDAGSPAPIPADGEKPLSHGTVSCVAVSPRFRTRTLARMDALGGAWADSRGRAADRAIGRAQKEALGEIDRMRREDSDRWKKASRRRHASDDSGLPVVHSPAARLGLGTGLAGLDRVIAPWHSTSVTRAGILTPWITQGGPMLDGPTIGVDWLTGEPFRFDAWSPYREHMTTSVNMLIIGMMGTGKSMCLKTLADREIAWGRNILVEGDPKGEWERFALMAGGDTVRVGAGQVLNPLDVGGPADGESGADWAERADSMRADALKGLAMAIRPERPLDMAEQAVAGNAVRVLREKDGGEPDLTGLVRLLASDWAERAGIRGLSPSQARDAADRLTLVFDTLVDGPLRGAFDGPSTVRIDPASPITVFDTGTAGGEGSQRKAVYTAAMAAAIDRVCRSGDGVFRLVIAEEGWDVLRNPALVEGWDRRMRLSGELGVANVMLMHELGDLEQAGAPDSAERRRIEGILTKSSTMVIYQQSPSSLAQLRRLVPDLTDDEARTVSDLPQGVGLWRVGKVVRQLVFPRVSRAEYRVFNTDAGRAG